MATLSLVSLSLCILIMFNPELSHFYLACIGREELFGWVILAQLQTLLQLNKNDVLFLVKTNCVLSFKILWGEYFSIFFSLLWTELALVLHIIKHFFHLNLCLSQLQPDRFLCKARTKWRWVQRSTLAPHQVNIRHPINPSSDLAPHQGSCKWDHLEHVHTRANLLLEDLQVQKDSGFDSRYTIRKCNSITNWWIQYSPSGMKENYPNPIKRETL